MNRAWVCGGDYDGAEHPGSGCGAPRDSMTTQSLVQPPRHSSWPTCAAVSPFGDLRLSDVLPEFNQKLTGNAVRSTSMNRAWVCGGDYDGAEHPGSGCGALRDYTSTLSPPPSRDTFPTLATARAVALLCGARYLLIPPVTTSPPRCGVAKKKKVAKTRFRQLSYR